MGSRMTRCFGVVMWTGFVLLTASYVHASTDTDKIEERAFGHGPGGFGGNGGGDGGDGGFGRFGTGNGFGGFNGFAGFDIQTAMRYRAIHGILASLALVVLFPIGSIFMRLVPGRAAVWVHAATQIIGFIIYVAAAGLGLHLVRTVRVPFTGESLFDNPATKFHPIVGIVTLVTLVFQPLLGWLHHRQYKKLGRRTFWSHMHLWNGRFGVTGGIVNGVLGLRLANAPQNLRTAYIAVAAVMWVLWVACAITGEVRRRRALKRKGAVAATDANPAPAMRGVRRSSGMSTRERVIAPKASMTSRESESRRSRASRGSDSGASGAPRSSDRV